MKTLWNINSIYVKLILIFLLLVLPLYFVNLSINIKAANSNRQEIVRNLEVRLQLYMEYLEKEVVRLMDLKKEYILDADLLALSTTSKGMTAYGRVQSILNLQKRMQILKSSSSLIANTSIYIPSINRTINTFQYDLEINNEEFNIMKNTKSSYPFVYWQDRMFLSMAFPYDAITNNLPPYFVLSIEISKAVLNETIKGMMEYPDGGIILYADSMDEIASVGSSKKMIHAVKQLLSKYIEGQWTIQRDNINVENQKFITISYNSQYLGITGVIFVSSDSIKGSMQQFERWFWTIFVLSMFVIIIFPYWIYRIIHRPIKQLTYYFRRLEEGNMDLAIKHQLNDEFGYLYNRFNVMVERLNHLIKDALNHQMQIQQSELKWLQSQINPHFLYNTHFILSRLIRQNENELAYKFATHLGDYMKYITKNYAEDISLAEEMQHTSSYLGIQALCYEDRIKISLPEIPPFFSFQKVPRLILQPIIENTFKYVVDKKLGSSELYIGVEELEASIIIVFEDDGNMLQDEYIAELNNRLGNGGADHSQISGLMNIHRRLQAKYGEGFGLSFARSKLGGLKVVMRIKKDEVELDEKDFGSG